MPLTAQDESYANRATLFTLLFFLSVVTNRGCFDTQSTTTSMASVTNRGSAHTAGQTAIPRLDTPHNQIRLLRLHHGNANDELKITLSVENMSQLPKYEALSYVWGDDFSYKALVNGRETYITANLHAALRQFRHPTAARLMWIDAICINQQLTSERNHQVQMMGRIFSSARRVLLWLGPPADDSDYVLDYIQQGYPIGNLSGFKLRLGLHALCSRPWFTRIWIVQELALGKEDPILVCGQKGVRWSIFVKFLVQAGHIIRDEFQAPEFPYSKFKDSWGQSVSRSLQDLHYSQSMNGLSAFWKLRKDNEEIQTPYAGSDGSFSVTRISSISSDPKYLAEESWISAKFVLRKISTELHGFVSRIMEINNLRTTRPYDYLEIQVYRTREFRATDVRDKIYALLGISQFHDTPLIPDYSLPIWKIYAEVMKMIMTYRPEYGYPCFPLRPQTARESDWPSWLPNLAGSWASPKMYLVDQLCPNPDALAPLLTAMKNRSPLATFSKNLKIMSTRGRVLGTVDRVYEISLFNDSDVPHELSRMYRSKWMRDVPCHLLLDTIMVQNDTYRGLTPDKRGQLVQSFQEFWTRLSEPGSEFYCFDEFNWICEMIAQGHYCERVLFRTDTGLLGICPCNGVRVGDVLTGLFNIGMPFLLRKDGREVLYTAVCVAHVGCHRWGDDLLINTTEQNLENITYKTFNIR